MDVSALVAQMQETLSNIHTTLKSLDPNVHDARLDELEKKRDDAMRTLSAAFQAESEFLTRKRQAEREAIAERRRMEDEERERARREEDDGISSRDREEDQVRDGKLEEDAEGIERETDRLLNQAEEEAREAITEGRERLKALQEKRRVRAAPTPLFLHNVAQSTISILILALK